MSDRRLAFAVEIRIGFLDEDLARHSTRWHARPRWSGGSGWASRTVRAVRPWRSRWPWHPWRRWVLHLDRGVMRPRRHMRRYLFSPGASLLTGSARPGGPSASEDARRRRPRDSLAGSAVPQVAQRGRTEPGAAA